MSGAIPERDRARLRHVAGACERALRYVDGERSALDDERTYDAVLRCLTVVGEALGALGEETYARLPSLPPGLPKVQRNLIVHEYWRVDPAVVWATVTLSLPRLRDDVARVLDDG
ncbi:HepT-like ribonuclease domain-containing protein [Demequina pelophila]|uniref:HepT-like ribonuclease domain-containing protein n=1 Tax=Demequina pelophila TaxID=1638984 RepID=UPI0007829AB1|nr:HepT-like ribonuclease domain-containing protein [Demequina pelophila]